MSRGEMLEQVVCCTSARPFLRHAAAKLFQPVNHFLPCGLILEPVDGVDEYWAQGIVDDCFIDGAEYFRVRWWGYKQEAWDAIPWNAVISMRKGVRVAIKSDSEDFARRLNQEAANKAVWVAGRPPDGVARRVFVVTDSAIGAWTSPVGPDTLKYHGRSRPRGSGRTP